MSASGASSADNEDLVEAPTSGESDEQQASSSDNIDEDDEQCEDV